MKKKQPFYQVYKDEAEKSADIYLMSSIGEDMWNEKDECSAKRLVKEINNIAFGTKINVFINSPGGDVFDGISIYNALFKHRANLTVEVTGLAASIASIIMLAGDKRIINKGSFVMIHNASSCCWGKAEDMREVADLLDKIDNELIQIYKDRTNLKSEAEIRKLMECETWFTSTDSVLKGFGTEENTAQEEEKSSACINQKFVAKYRYKNVPKSVCVAMLDKDDSDDEKLEPTIRDAETALKEIGFSSSKAKGILAKGFRDENKEKDNVINEDSFTEDDLSDFGKMFDEMLSKN